MPTAWLMLWIGLVASLHRAGTRCKVELGRSSRYYPAFLGKRVSHLLTADEADKVQVEFECASKVVAGKATLVCRLLTPSELSGRQRLGRP